MDRVNYSCISPDSVLAGKRESIVCVACLGCMHVDRSGRNAQLGDGLSSMVIHVSTDVLPYKFRVSINFIDSAG